MTKDTGGPAFPSNFVDDREPGGFRDEPGMTLLDYYVGLAMQTVMEIRGGEKLEDIEHGLRAGGNEAKIAYQIAEAMIAEKRRRENG